MEDELLVRLLQQVDHGQPLVIQITGGEPTLVPEKVARLASLTCDFAVRPRLALQTNGTLLTTEGIELFRKYEIEVGISFDGPPEVQESLRGGCIATLQGMQLLEEAGIFFRVTSVVNSASVAHLSRMALLLAGFRCCRGIGLDLLVQRGRGTALTLPEPEALLEGAAQLASIVGQINRRRQVPLRIRELDLLRRGGGGLFCHAASAKSVAVDVDGRLFPCGQTLGDMDFSLGTVDAPLASAEKNLAGVRLSAGGCEACTLAGRCPGECPSRLHYNGLDGALICSLYQGLWRGAMEVERIIPQTPA